MKNINKKIIKLIIPSLLMFGFGYAHAEESRFNFLADNVDGELQKPIIENKVGIKPAQNLKFPELNLPKQELHPDILFGFLLAEISRQRGYLGISVDAYLEIAKRTRDPRLARRATELAIRGTLTKQIFESAKLWLETEPTSTQARQTLAAVLVGQQRLEESKIYLQELLVGDNEKIKKAFLNFNGLFARQQDKQAVFNVVDYLAKAHADKPEAHFAVAQSAINAKRYETAKIELEEALRLSPRWEQAIGLLGQVLNELSRIDAEKSGKTMSSVNIDKQPAVIVYRDFLQKYPDSREVRTYYARLLTFNREYDKAKEQFQILAQAYPKNPEMLLVIGLLALQAKHYEQADVYLNQALSLQKNENDKNMIRSYLGQLYEDKQDYNKSIEIYKTVSQGEFYLSSAVRIAVIYATKINKLPEARRLLKDLQAVAKSKNDTDQEAELIAVEAGILKELNFNNDAYNLLSNGLKHIPNHGTLLYDRAMLAEKMNHIDQAEKDLKLLIKLQPNHAHAYNALGYTLLEKTKRYKEAKQYIEKALALSPHDGFILDSLGWLYFKMGDYAKAVTYLERAYNERSDNEIGSHLLEALVKTQNMMSAEKLLKRLLEEYPKDKRIHELQQKYFSK